MADPPRADVPNAGPRPFQKRFQSAGAKTLESQWPSTWAHIRSHHHTQCHIIIHSLKTVGSQWPSTWVHIRSHQVQIRSQNYIKSTLSSEEGTLYNVL
jgi:hypothetical protein